MDNYQILAVIIVALAIAYSLFVRPRLKEKLTTEQIDVIDYAVDKGLDYAETLYKGDTAINKDKVALEYACDVIVRSGAIGERYMGIIKVMIEEEIEKRTKK